MVCRVESLQRLRILREVALQGSFTAAAAQLHLSQPAVSQHMSSLEREIGMRLVNRSVTGTHLTPAGEITLRHALHILQAVDAARREIAGLQTGLQTPLRVAAFSTACTFLLPPAASSFRRRHPGLDFELAECDADEAIEHVRHARSDLAIAFDYAAHPLDLQGLTARHLADDSVSLAVPDRHPAAMATVVDIGDLADEPWISGTAFACRESLRTVCGAAGYAPRVAIDSNHYATTLGLVGSGHGIALVPQSALGNLPRGVLVRPLRPSAPPRRIWAVTAAQPRLPLLDLIDELAAELHGPGTVASG
jgi:DNA-binding transcriptional LysR family regulator